MAEKDEVSSFVRGNDKALEDDTASTKEKSQAITGVIPTTSDVVKGAGPDDGDNNTRIDAGVAPDGGRTAWLVVLGAWCCSFSSPGWVNSVGSFQQYYQFSLLHGYSSSTIAWIPSLQVFFLFALGPLVGALFDRYGPRPLIISGTLLHVFGLMMASLSTKYYQLILSQGMCSAIGVALIFQPAVACVSTWFSKRRGTAMGVLSTGSSIGGVVFPILISRMTERVGYPWTMRTAAFIILGLQIIAIITVRPRIKPTRHTMPAGRYLAPFRELGFLVLMIGIFILAFGQFSPLDFVAEEAYQDAHVSEEMSQYLVTIYNGVSLIGRLSSGIIADAIGRWNTFIIMSALSGIAELAVWIPATKLSVAISFVVFFGCAAGAFTGLVGALPASVSAPNEIGYRLGMIFLAYSVPALVVGPIGGAIIQSRGWLALKVFAGVMCLSGSVALGIARLRYTEGKFWKVF